MLYLMYSRPWFKEHLNFDDSKSLFNNKDDESDDKSEDDESEDDESENDDYGNYGGAKRKPTDECDYEDNGNYRYIGEVEVLEYQDNYLYAKRDGTSMRGRRKR